MSEPEKIFHAVFNELAQLKTMGAWHSLALLSIAQEIGQQQLAAHSKDATVTLAKRGKWRLESGKRQTAQEDAPAVMAMLRQLPSCSCGGAGLWL